jgi:hypothetical protein
MPLIIQSSQKVFRAILREIKKQTESYSLDIDEEIKEKDQKKAKLLRETKQAEIDDSVITLIHNLTFLYD